MSLSPEESRRVARVLDHPLLRERKREVYRVVWALDCRPDACRPTLPGGSWTSSKQRNGISRPSILTRYPMKLLQVRAMEDTWHPAPPHGENGCPRSPLTLSGTHFHLARSRSFVPHNPTLIT